MAKKKAKKQGKGSKKAAGKGGALSQWLSAGLGIAASMMLLAVAVALGLRFFSERPQDLYAHSEILLDQVSASFDTLFIPPENIDISDPEAREAGRTRWLHYDINVTVPPHVRLDGLADVLGRELLPYGIGTEIQTQSEDRADLALQFGDFPFAQITLHGTRQARPSQRDIREESYALAGDVQDVLEGQSALVRRVDALGAVESSDAEFRYATTRLEVDFVNDGAPALVAERLREALQGAPSTGVTLSRERSGPVLRVFLHGKTVVELRGVAHTPPVLMPSSPPLESEAPESLSETAEAAMADPEAAEETSEPDPQAPPVLVPRTEAMPGVTPLPPPLEDLPLNAPAEGEIIDTIEAEPAAVRLPQRPTGATGRPRLALILDDGGYGGAHTETILRMSPKLTLAILPNTPFGRETAERAHALGFEIMLHMPMETGNGNTTFPGEIQTAMTAEKIRELTLDAIAQVPGLKGANNHTGSKFTANPEKMAEFLAVIEEQNLYFIDSVTRGDTQAWRVAYEMGIPTTRRDLFIDHDMSEAMITQRFEELIAMAKTKGSAIGIAHFRPLTVRVLEPLMYRIEEEGVELVHASELLQ